MIGKKIGKYQIVQNLIQGDMAEVYLATRAELDGHVALKLLNATVSSPEEKRRFMQEAGSLARLDHPNIIQVIDYAVDLETNRPYMVFKLIEGESLEEYLTRLQSDNRTLQLAEVEQIIGDLCAALGHAHHKGVVHRDVKPGNVVRDKDGRLILTNFGLARPQADTGTTTSGILGTPAHLAPEQIRGEKIDGRADLYALGVMLYRLLTGQLPYPDDKSVAINDRLTTPVPDPRAIRSDLPSGLAHFVIKSMAISPDDRCQTADEFLAEFRGALVTAKFPAPPATGLETPILPVAMAQAAASPPSQPQDQMTDEQWNREAIRQCLNAGFNDDEIEDLCFYNFPAVSNEFGGGMGKSQKIRVLISHCLRHHQMKKLVNAIEQANPEQYNRFKPKIWEKLSEGGWPMAPFLATADLSRFVGREEDLAKICRLLTHQGGSHIIAITGMSGIGKTAYATRIAHQLRPYFADGVLWGNALKSKPLTILSNWAHAFQCDFSRLDDLDSCARAMNDVLADKEVLIVLDDVWSADKVRPLLIGGPRCAVLLTTRSLEVAAALHARSHPLEALLPAECLQLMSGILENDKRLTAEESVAYEIFDLLMRLPLAVEIASQLLLARAGWTLSDLAEQLRDEQERLDMLKVSDRAVHASFELSWNALDVSQRRGFASCAVFHGRPFTVEALATVAEMDRRKARNCLDSLVALSLVMGESQPYYHQHPLLADYALEKLGQDQAASARMAQYYLGFAQERKSKYAELEAEWNNIWAGLQVARRQKMWQVVLDYAEALKDMWFAQGRYTDARQAYEWAVESARALDNRKDLASNLRQWGRACLEQEDYVEADKLLSDSLQVSQDLTDVQGVASNQYYLARSALEQDHYQLARQLLVDSRRIRKQLKDVVGVAATLFEEARTLFRSGDYTATIRLAKQALKIQEGANDKHGLVQTLRLLADTASDQQMSDLAKGYGLRALTLAEELEDKGEQALILETLSHVHRHQGHLESALACAQKSLDLLKNTGDRGSQALVLDQLSMIYASRGQTNKALEVGLQSLALCRELPDKLLTACVLMHNGDYYQDLAQTQQAQVQWHEAMDIALTIKNPALIAELRRRLG